MKFIEARHNLKEFGNMTQCNGSVFFPLSQVLVCRSFSCTRHSPLDVVAWYGSHVPCTFGKCGDAWDQLSYCLSVFASATSMNALVEPRQV